ncbi:MAG: hypothetical protein Q9195_000066 [Heterodermia aff. obscurata]
MAAGIGEASAILAVAQLGISLSNSLISYIGEVQDAPFRIQRISNEVATTSERLRDIGGLVAKNQQTNIFSEEGITSAIRCSDECRKIIEDVKNVLRKGGWQRRSTAFDKEEIDTSLFSALRWPFLKRSLEVPRAELQRIKIDLSLLFSSAMALGASTSYEKVKFSQDIPGLQKTRDWAARMADQARHRAKDRSADFPSRGRPHDVYWTDDEPELLEDFVAYQERRIREEEDKKAQERALLLQAEQEAKRKQEEEAKREIEQRAIDSYKKEQDEIQTRTTESKETFRRELLRLGLPPDQIALIIDNSNLDFGGDDPNANVPIVRSTRGVTSGGTTTHTDAGSTDFTNEETAPSRANGRSRKRLPWRNLRKSNSHESPEPSLDFVLSDGSSATNDSIMIETWLLDVFSNWHVEIMPSAEWIEKKFRKHRKRQDVWHCFAGLKPLWRDAILQFLRFKNDGNTNEWSLYLIELPHHNSRMGLRGFRGSKYDDQLVQVVIFKRKDSFEASNDNQGGTKYTDNSQLPDTPRTSRPINSYFNQGLTDAQVHPNEQQPGGLPRPKVSFAHRVDEKTDNKNSMSAIDQPLRFSTKEEVQNAIKTLGKRKTKIGATDQERVDEINDMIVLLAAQLKLHDTLSPSQRRILHGENGYDQTSATDKKSHTNTNVRNPETSPRAFHSASAVTDRTEEISIPRDYRNRPIEKDGTMLPVIIGRRRELPGYLYDSNGFLVPAIPGKELVVRQKSPSRHRSFERHRAREPSQHRHQSRDRDRERHRSEADKRRPSSLERDEYYSPDRDGIVNVIGDKERPRPRGMDGDFAHHRSPYYDSDEEGIILIREDKGKGDHKDELVIRRDARERERPDYERAEVILRERRDSLSSADENMRAYSRDWPRQARHILYHRPYRSPSPVYIRRASTFDDGTWPGAEGKALVLRTGGSRPTPGYMQEHILDRSIRVRGEQEILSSPEYPNITRFRSPADSRQSSYSERHRAFLPRRSTFDLDSADDERYVHFHTGKPSNPRKESSHRKPRNRDLERVKNRHQRSRRTISSSEDDDYLGMPDRIASKQQSKPSDEEVIAQTLKRFTTFQGDQLPNATENPSAVDSLRRHSPPQNRDSIVDLDRQRGKGRELETMSEEPDAMPNGNGPRSPSQAPFYPSTNRFPPPPPSGPPRSPGSNSGSPRNPRARSRGRGYNTDGPDPVYRPQDYYNFLNSPISPLLEPEQSNNVEIDSPRLSSDDVNPALESSIKPAPKVGAVANGQSKGSKEPRITELSDGSSEGGRRKLHRKDRKATVEDFEPDLEAGKIDASLDLYE